MNKILLRPQINICEDGNYVIDLNAEVQIADFEIFVSNNVNCTLLFYGCGLKQGIKVFVDECSNIRFQSFLKNVDMNIVVNLIGCNANVDFIYSQLADVSTNLKIDVNHLQSYTSSNLYNHIVQYGQGFSKILVNAKVNTGNKGCILKQDNKIIVTNDGKGEILPNLLIDEYDCFAQHSAYISKFSNDELFYLMSRGISYHDALFLLIKSFLLGKFIVDDDMLEKFNGMIMDVKGGIYHES